MRKKTPKRKGRIPQRRLELEYVDIDRLKEWKENPRRNDEAAERLAELFEHHGFVVPIIATRDEIIRAGHTRLKGAKRKGMRQVPVIWVDFDSEEEAQLFSLSENVSHEYSEWEPELLKELFEKLEEALPETAVAASGFSRIRIQGITGEGEPSSPLQDAAAQFEKQVRDAKMQEEWVWFAVPDKETAEALVERYGLAPGGKAKGKSKRQLDWEAVRRRLLQLSKRKER